MSKARLPSPEVLRQLLRYQPETGKLFWRVTRSSKAYAGREAFTAVKSTGYKHGRIDGATILAHRAVWAIVYGHWPELYIDHVNGDKMDNRLSNLRQADASQNAWNQAIYRSNKSGFRGVFWNSRSAKWHARINRFGKTINLGLFDRIESAAEAYKRAETELRGEFRRNPA